MRKRLTILTFAIFVALFLKTKPMACIIKILGALLTPVSDAPNCGILASHL
jgi:hypothetical protein